MKLLRSLLLVMAGMLLATSTNAGIFKTSLASENAQLVKWMDEYKNRLGMSDWHVEIEAVPAIPLWNACGQPCFGVSQWDLATHQGRVWVLQRADYSQLTLEHLGTDAKTDQRDTVIHELLHCVFDNMNNEVGVALTTGLITHPGQAMHSPSHLYSAADMWKQAQPQSIQIQVPTVTLTPAPEPDPVAGPQAATQDAPKPPQNQ